MGVRRDYDGGRETKNLWCNNMVDFGSVSLDVKRGLCKKVIVPMVTFSEYTFSFRTNAKNKLNLREMKYL